MMETHFKRAVKFGAALVRTRDLDPVYVALAAAHLDDATLARTLLTYFCLYYLGAAVHIGALRGDAYWEALERAAVNADLSWPRGAERRHWRGRAAIEAARWLREHYEDNPSGVVFSWYNQATGRTRNGFPPFSLVAAEVKRAPSFGPWIAFKVADMMERVMRLPVDFSDCALGVYREPRAGAALVLKGSDEASITDAELEALVQEFIHCRQLRGLTAPPYDDRALNVQEVETILCKYKSHCNGYYPVGKDAREVVHALSDARWGAAANRMGRRLYEATADYKFAG